MNKHVVVGNAPNTYLYSDANHTIGDPPKPVTRVVHGDPMVQTCTVTGVYTKTELEDDAADASMVGAPWAVTWFKQGKNRLFCDFSTKEPIGKHANYYVEIDPTTRDLRFFKVLRNGLMGDHVNTWRCMAKNCKQTISWRVAQHL